MDIFYDKDERFAYQTIKLRINSPVNSVFAYIGTDQINRWFPELSFDNEQDPKELHFALENDGIQKLSVIEYDKPNRFVFTWDTGKITFNLTEKDDQTLLHFEERLPLSLENISEDFAGWYFKILSLQDLAEIAKIRSLDREKFKLIQEQIANQLNLPQ